jgi:6-phosphogluconolactonase
MNDDFNIDGISDFDSQLDLTIYANQDELVREVSAQALQVIEDRLLTHGHFDLVLTGGTLGNAISAALVSTWNQAPDMYSGLHIWWSDERFVASDSEERNAFPLHGKLLNSNITVHETIAVDSGKSISDAVIDYQSALEEVVIDLNILGLGPDGHVASLFPGIADLDDERDIFAITDSPKPPSARISFTMNYINQGREVWIVAAGESKAGAVAKIIEGDTSIPASYVSAVERTRLMLDQAAFLAD